MYTSLGDRTRLQQDGVYLETLRTWVRGIYGETFQSTEFPPGVSSLHAGVAALSDIVSAFPLCNEWGLMDDTPASTPRKAVARGKRGRIRAQLALPPVAGRRGGPGGCIPGSRPRGRRRRRQRQRAPDREEITGVCTAAISSTATSATGAATTLSAAAASGAPAGTSAVSAAAGVAGASAAASASAAAASTVAGPAPGAPAGTSVAPASTVVAGASATVFAPAVATSPGLAPGTAVASPSTPATLRVTMTPRAPTAPPARGVFRVFALRHNPLKSNSSAGASKRARSDSPPATPSKRARTDASGTADPTAAGVSSDMIAPDDDLAPTEAGPATGSGSSPTASLSEAPAGAGKAGEPPPPRKFAAR
ncbi:endochitinase A-like [Brachypodium distachyon]|uniref:endochitinase A-like n=1 Tax=Brachypodium distachyon TaxID=15368 RepID=UPI000D0E083A|nr:endochitinase A-like [Brachypodium distachyon]|eukprot:XP_024315889.1 endochitinase A-like [Brachypodium distachyon]